MQYPASITDSIIPPESEVAHDLLQWSEMTDTSTWNIANLTNELCEELDGVHMPDGRPITKKDVYKAVATRCKGRKPNTIRRWAEVASDFPLEVQERFRDLLSFDHFKVSRRLFTENLTPSITYGLEWCIESNDDRITAGRFRTVGDMLSEFMPEMADDTAHAYWNGVKEKLYDKILLIDNDTTREKALRAHKEMSYALEEQNVDIR